MADDVAITAGSGTTIGADERTINGTAVKVQRVVTEGGTACTTGQVAVTASAATLVAARETRKWVTILNGSNLTIYVGPASVTTGNGFALAPGAALTLATTILVQQIAASITGLTGTTYYAEVYDFVMQYDSPATGALTPLVISTCSRNAATWPLTSLHALTAPASATSVANDAVYVPIWIPQTAVFVSAYVSNGSAPAGNCDIGIYAEDGTKLGSTGATAKSGATAIQRIALSASVTLTPGRYYIAYSESASTANSVVAWAAQVNNGRWVGMYRQATAHPLPSPATFATWASAILPVFGIGQQAF